MPQTKLFSSILTFLILVLGVSVLAYSQSEQTITPEEKSAPVEKSEEEILRDQISDLRTQITTKAQRIEQYTKHVAELERRLELVKQWNDNPPRFVLGHSTSRSLLGIVDAGDTYSVVAKASGSDVKLASSVIRSLNIPFVRTGSAVNFADQLERKYDVGQSLDSTDSQKLASDYWKTWRFLADDLKPNQPLQFACFREASQPDQRVVLLKEKRPEEIVIRRAGAVADETIQRHQIRPGSLWVDNDDRVLQVVEPGDSFLDYALLRAVQRLGKPDGEKGHVSVVIESKIDRSVKASLKYHYYWYRARYFFGYYGFHFARIVEDPNAVSEMEAKVARSLNDEIHERMINLGVPVLEREHLDNLQRELKISGDEDNYQLARYAGATHKVICEVDEATSKGKLRLNIRVVDLSSGQAVFAINDERTAPRINDTNKHFVQSGTPEILKLVEGNSVKSQPQDLELFGTESPIRVPLYGVSLDRLKNKTFLALVEGELNNEIYYRPLFGRGMHRLPKEWVSRRTLTGDINSDLNDVDLRAQKLRYVIYRLCKNAMTPSGRLLDISPDGRTARVTMGSKHGLNEGDLLRAVRVSEVKTESPGLFQSTGSVSESILSTLMFARSVSEFESEVVITPNPLGSYWDADRFTPQFGDVVLSRVDTNRRFAIYPPDWQDPDPSMHSALQWSKPLYRGRHIEAIKNLQKEIRGSLVTGFQSLVPAYPADIKTFSKNRYDRNDLRRPFGTPHNPNKINDNELIAKDATLADAENQNATHVIGGELHFTKKRDTYRLILKINEIGYNKDGTVDFGDAGERMEFQIRGNEWQLK